ncbi:MAG: hypothetical protein FD143_2899 [Ignavibacteria bacterium]|nr:MAG: hypothetical protein FD143_2899 [Ignavibacteria bacterium]
MRFKRSVVIVFLPIFSILAGSFFSFEGFGGSLFFPFLRVFWALAGFFVYFLWAESVFFLVLALSSYIFGGGPLLFKEFCLFDEVFLWSLFILVGAGLVSFFLRWGWAFFPFLFFF